MKKIAALSLAMLMTPGLASAESFLFVFFNGNNAIGSVPMTDNAGARCASGQLQPVPYCARNLYICSSNVAKFNQLSGGATGFQLKSQDRGGMPVVRC